MRVLVTGGSGVLGRQVVQMLRDRGVDDVRALSRKALPERSGREAGTGRAQGDLETGVGLAQAVEGVDVIVHCASAGDPRHPQRDLLQTRNLLVAAGGNRPRGQSGQATPHVVYISIVGVDRVRFGLYRAKLVAERMIAESGLPWTVLRATQFHELILMLAMMTTKGPVALTPRGLRSQPVESAEVARRLADLALQPPAGRVPDLGGPQVQTIEEMTRDYLDAAGRIRPVLRIPVPGKAAADFRAGNNLLGPDGVRVGRTFAEYLRERVGPDVTIAAPYDLSGRGHVVDSVRRTVASG
jgi:uncharacterized protein YbjT (DUF2867 family)